MHVVTSTLMLTRTDFGDGSTIGDGQNWSKALGEPRMVKVVAIKLPIFQGRHAVLWSVLLMLPCLYLAIKLYVSGLEWTYDLFFMVIRLVVIVLFLGGGVLMVWSLRRLKAPSRIYVAATYLTHCIAFAILLNAFGRVGGLP